MSPWLLRGAPGPHPAGNGPWALDGPLWRTTLAGTEGILQGCAITNLYNLADDLGGQVQVLLRVVVGGFHSTKTARPLHGSVALF